MSMPEKPRPPQKGFLEKHKKKIVITLGTGLAALGVHEANNLGMGKDESEPPTISEKAKAGAAEPPERKRRPERPAAKSAPEKQSEQAPLTPERLKRHLLELLRDVGTKFTITAISEPPEDLEDDADRLLSPGFANIIHFSGGFYVRIGLEPIPGGGSTFVVENGLGESVVSVDSLEEVDALVKPLAAPEFVDMAIRYKGLNASLSVEDRGSELNKAMDRALTGDATPEERRALGATLSRQGDEFARLRLDIMYYYEENDLPFQLK